MISSNFAQRAGEIAHLAVILVKTTPLQMPIWALTLSIAIAALFLIPYVGAWFREKHL